MAYASADDLALLLGIGPVMPADQAGRACLLLDLAAGRIEQETGQSLTLATETVTLPGGDGPILVLPRWPVTALASVTRVNARGDSTVLTPGVDYRWDRAGILTRRRGCWHAEDDYTAEVTAGHDPVPDSVRALNLDLAARAWPNSTGLKAESLGDYSVTYGTLGGQLQDSDIAALCAYRARSTW